MPVAQVTGCELSRVSPQLGRTVEVKSTDEYELPVRVRQGNTLSSATFHFTVW